MENKQLYTMTADDFAKWLTKGIDFETSRDYKNRDDKNNARKAVKAYKTVKACLGYVNAETAFTVEGVRGKANRPFDMPNLGSLMECVVNCLKEKEPASSYAKHFKDDEADVRFGFMGYEIKTCIGATSRNTPIQGDKPVLLINQVGVFSIRKADIEGCLDASGRLPYNKAIGKRWNSLSKKMGLMSEEDEEEA